MKYTVKLYPRAYRDLDEIYSYIALNLTEPETANKMISALEEAVYSLEQFPERGSIRRTGAFANQDYRQISICKFNTILQFFFVRINRLLQFFSNFFFFYQKSRSIDFLLKNTSIKV